MSWAVWITGPPGSGKSTIARAVETELRARGRRVKPLELDEVRKFVTPTPRYSDGERDTVYRALGWLAQLLVEAGIPVLIDATAHRRAWRDLVRSSVPDFAEVQLACPLEVCRQRERARTPGNAPRDIYAHAGRPGATVPGVDVLYEPALAPELLIDTSVQSLPESVSRIVRLVEQRGSARVGEPPRQAEPAGPGWAIWIAGRPGTGKSTLAAYVAGRLREQGARVRVLGLASLRRALLGGRAAAEHEQDIVHRVLAYAAKLLTEAGISVIVDATATRRAWRDAARALIPGFAEVQLQCPLEICLERERAARWGLTFEAGAGRPAPGPPDIELDYEEPAHADLTIRTDVHDVHTAADRVLIVAERLARRSRP